MKKKVLFSLCLLASAGIQAQIGVNNTDPKASLHITPQKTDGTTAEGIIAPNLTRAQLIGKDVRYTAAQKGAIVYVTTLDGTISAKTTKITNVGYYYFDGALWQPFSQAETVIPTEPWRVQGGAAQATSNTENIYQAGKVAIGVAQTGAALGQSLYVNGATLLLGTTQVGTTAAPANAAISGTSTLTGKVGIGRAPATSHILAIEGNTYSKGNITNEGDLTVTAGGLTVSSTGTFTLAGNGVGAGKYLASDAAGKGTWTALPTTATTEPWRVQGGTTLATSNTENIYQAGTVSIGGTAAVPAGYKLLVSGSSQVNGSLKVQETGIFGTSGTAYPNTNYTLHVFGGGNLGGLWVEKRANLKSNVLIGENLTAADNALMVNAGTTVLKGATTIGTAAAPATLNVTGTTTSKATNMGGLLKYKPTAAAVTVGQYMKASAVDGSVEWATLPATATTEPWQVQGATTAATTNAQNIYQTGSIGIGASTAVPAAYKLQVTGASNVTGNSRVASSTVVGAQTVGTTLGVTGATTLSSTLSVAGTSSLKGATTVGTAAAPANLTVTGTSALQKATTVGTTTANANLVVYGNAGIGASPLHKLHVMGNEYVSGTARIGGVATASTFNASAQMELADNNKGFLPNRVALTGHNVKAPVTNAVNGMLVYNTAKVGLLNEGFYYWDTDHWQAFVTEIPENRVTGYDLTTTVNSIATSPAASQGGALMSFGDVGTTTKHFTVKEGGSYAFAIRVYGVGTPQPGKTMGRACVYFTLMINGIKIDVQEVNWSLVNPAEVGAQNRLGGTVMLTGNNLKVGDKVEFRLAHYNTGWSQPVSMSANPGLAADKTSLVFWKL